MSSYMTNDFVFVLTFCETGGDPGGAGQVPQMWSGGDTDIDEPSNFLHVMWSCVYDTVL